MPNFRWEIDSTRIDLYVLDPITRKLIRARPTLYIVFERFCDAPIGLHLDIHPPCTNGFLAALRNAILPKNYVRQCFPQVQTDWMLCGFPVEVFADNGNENWSIHTQAALAAMRLGIAYLPPYVPRYKPGVERFFRTLNQLLAHKLPGTTLGKKLPKRELDPQRDAKLTLVELAELLHVTIIDEYMHMTMGRGHMTHNRKWLSGLQIHDIELPVDEKEFDLTFCRPDSRTLRQTGIHIRDMRFQSDDLAELYGRMGREQKVKLLKPSDPNLLYVVNPLNGNPIKVDAVDGRVASPLPYASLLPLEDEELEGVQTEEDLAVIEQAQKRKQDIITSAKLRKVSDELTASDVKETFGRAPSFQDIAREAAAPPPAPPAAVDPLMERLRRKLQGES
ncbi:hypothetical protein [Variovorax sp. JS1663]|uniref:hypothetical protein n=1 Tax=Variovorax sp. JS1663 TaxID=1851577 RepID=UPI000B3489EE|nr:hypothetical protein [Variovorax sp. JS1663]OUM02975.1 hypothetical protein A8M77_08520 [Variovorax sp. JS1663]